MEEEIIKITIDMVKSEVNGVNIDSLEGLCFFFSSNVMAYLIEQGFDVKMCNIRDLTEVNYDHYFLIAANNKYLIDLTYSQFLPKDEQLRFFEKWPAEIFKENSPALLNQLLTDGYIKLTDNYLDLYLGSFKPLSKERGRL